jgi:hypothetical protein
VTKLLVSFCNLWVHDLALGHYDVDTSTFQWLDLSGEGIPVTGVSGICFAHDYCWCLLSPSHDQCYLAMLDKDLTLRRTFPLEDVRDPHTLLAIDDGFLLNDTGRNQVTRLAFQGDGLRVISVWRPDDSFADGLHINSVACLAGVTIVSMFGEKPADGWASAIQGRVVNITTGDVLADNLVHPHSLLVSDGTLYWLESQPGLVHRFTASDGHSVLGKLDGYLRGIARDGEYLYVAASARRRRSRSSGTMNAPVAETSSLAHSWLYRLHLGTLDHDRTQFTAYGSEIFDLAVVPPDFAVRSLPSVDAVSQRIWRAEDALIQTRFELERVMSERQARVADSVDEIAMSRVPHSSELVAKQAAQISELQQSLDDERESKSALPQTGSDSDGTVARRFAPGIRRSSPSGAIRTRYSNLFGLAVILLVIAVGAWRALNRLVGRPSVSGSRDN